MLKIKRVKILVFLEFYSKQSAAKIPFFFEYLKKLLGGNVEKNGSQPFLKFL
tara:strand:+ start:60485 stop:60640 length:156 start_codon:yes stop_codon:yes gene_type:complete